MNHSKKILFDVSKSTIYTHVVKSQINTSNSLSYKQNWQTLKNVLKIILIVLLDNIGNTFQSLKILQNRLSIIDYA